MKLNKFELRKNIEQGIPTADIMDSTLASDLSLYVKNAEAVSLIAHKTLHDHFHNQSPLVTAYSDDENEPDKYISFLGRDNNPLFGPWNPERPASDIGIRSANPHYEGIVNPTTVIHADSHALEEFQINGAPSEVVDAIAAIATLNAFVEEAVAKPYLAAVAKSFGINPDVYLKNFFSHERTRREQILTRVIMYHLVAAPGKRPVGTDGTPLLIREHVDKSSWTIDIHQTAPGLQHRVGQTWHDASTDIAAFRGTADSYLPARLPATLHRAVMHEHDTPQYMRNVGIGRIAVPMFISPIHENARIVESNSVETHPTEQQLYEDGEALTK